MRKRNLARARTSASGSPPGRYPVSRLKWLKTAVAIALAGCTASADSAQQQSALPAADTVTAASSTPVGSEIAAEFFTAVKTTGSCPNDTTCVYVQTFPGDATREITLIVSPGRQYSPSAADQSTSKSGAPYGFQYASTADADSTVTINMNYFIPPDLMGNRAVKVGTASPSANFRLASFSPSAPLQAKSAGIAWTEVGKKGADVAIGAIIDKAKEGPGKVGGTAGRLGTIYSIASLLSDVSESLDLSKQHRKWLAELENLEKCAANPTNRLALKDPGYSARTVKTIQGARSELTEVTGVRYLNKMTEGAASLTPVTGVMSIGLKDGFVWNEQTLGDYSENTIMREARLAVTKCDDVGTDATGNMTYTSDCTASASPNSSWREQVSVVANVTWKWKMGVLYRANGTYTYKHTDTKTSRGQSCVDNGVATGSLTDFGNLKVLRTAEEEANAGYGYDGFFHGPEFTVQYTSSCRPPYTLPGSLHWLPHIRGPRGSTGQISGQATGQSCPTGPPAVLKWNFALDEPGK